MIKVYVQGRKAAYRFQHGDDVIYDAHAIKVFSARASERNPWPSRSDKAKFLLAVFPLRVVDAVILGSADGSEDDDDE